MRFISRLLTHNFTKIPLLWIGFNLQKFREDGPKDSCYCELHPELQDDQHIITVMNELCDYIREHYNMEKIV